MFVCVLWCSTHSVSCICFSCPMLSVSLNCLFCIVPSVFSNVYVPVQGRIQDFKLRGGGGGGGGGGGTRKFWDISCEKSRFYAKKSYFFQLRREVRKFWGISCEKSRFYAKKSYFFFNYRGVRAGCAPLDPPLLYTSTDKGIDKHIPESNHKPTNGYSWTSKT